MARNLQFRVWSIPAPAHKPWQGPSAAGTSRVISERAATAPALFFFWTQYLTNNNNHRRGCSVHAIGSHPSNK